MVAVVNQSDVDRVSRYRWFPLRSASKRENWSAIAHVTRDGVRTTLYMHRLIMRAPDGVDVDHRDGDGLNNRRKNLRLCTPTQNGGNMVPWKNHGLKGVYFSKAARRYPRPWRAHIGVGNKIRYLGSFATRRQAALAYNTAARKVFGPFARLNRIR
jgi:hypothetical protein